MNEKTRFEQFENKRRWHHYKDRLSHAQKLGYETLSEAIVKEYRKLRSFKKTAECLNLSRSGVQFVLHAFGEPTQSRGGYREGDRRRGKRTAHQGPLQS